MSSAPTDLPRLQTMNNTPSRSCGQTAPEKHRRSFWTWLRLALGLALAAQELAALPPAAAFDAVPFGEAAFSSDAREYVVSWEESRKLRSVEVSFPAGFAPRAGALRLAYWVGTWDGERDPVRSEQDVGRAGWQAVDDWTKGRWQEAATTEEPTSSGRVFRFLPTAAPEFPNLKGPGVAFRRTLKLKLVSEIPLPPDIRIRAFTDSVEQTVEARILFGEPALKVFRPSEPEAIRLEVHNGKLLESGAVGQLRMADGGRPGWNLPAGGSGELRASFAAALNPDDPAQDRTIVTVRAGARSFSFATADLVEKRTLLIDDLGVLVAAGDSACTLEEARRSRSESPARTVLERVAAEPEQTLTRAWDGMRTKKQLYFMHGLPGNRNAIRQDPEGQVRIAAGDPWFTKQPSERDKNKLWTPQGRTFFYYFGFPDNQHRGTRELAEGYLPLLRMTWMKDGVLYEQQSILDKLDGNWTDLRVDDPTVLLMRVRLFNTSSTNDAEAGLFLTARGNDAKETLYAEGDRILANWQGQPRLRYTFERHGRGELKNEAEGVRWRIALRPGERCELDFRIPSVTPSTPEELAQLGGHDFERDSRRICDYWRAQTDRGARIRTPEPWLNDFYRAHVRHLIINCFKDFDTDDLFAHVGTIRYGAYPNESVMMIANLDERGYRDEARRCMEPFLRHQGTVKLLGNFQSAEGLLYGAKGHEMGNYNKSHGYLLWCLAKHWRMTRDRAWLEHAAPGIVAGCEWIVRERRATMTTRPDGSHPIEYGFLPAGALEDVKDYWHWQATNTATVWGFEAAAQALADIGHPEAERLQREARAYRDDVLRGLTESRVRSPVVRLRDGTYVPYYPSRLELRGRAEGWVRETLEGPLFLLSYSIIPPFAPEADWILKDYEDNRFVSGQHGYTVSSFNRFWFSRGGIAMQANLLETPEVYLYRDDVKGFLRAYFNSFASGFFPEVRMINEHALSELGQYQGDHFKTSDEAQSCRWLREMFVREEGDTLYLGQAVPRYWLEDGGRPGIEKAPTEFGEMSLSFFSQAAQGRIVATLTPPTRNPPARIFLRFRHPQEAKLVEVTVNGQPCASFDPAKEWVVLPGAMKGPQEIVAHYAVATATQPAPETEQNPDPFP